MYKHECECGGALVLIGFKGSCSIPLTADGFYLGDGPCDTEDEVVMCEACGKMGELEYIEEES